MFRGSNDCELVDNLVGTDLANINSLILNGVQMIFKIYPNNQNFILLNGDTSSNKEYTFHIISAKLSVAYIDLFPAVMLAIEKTLETKPAIYNFLKSDFRSFSVASGSTSYVVDSMFPVVPSSVIVVLIRQSAYNGNETQNPFYFENCKLGSMTLCVGSNEICPRYQSLDSSR